MLGFTVRERVLRKTEEVERVEIDHFHNLVINIASPDKSRRTCTRTHRWHAGKQRDEQLCEIHVDLLDFKSTT